MKKILFLHGFFATGGCPMARALREVYAELQANPIFKVFYLKDIDGWMTNLGHVKGLEKRDEFAKPIHFKF